MSVALSRPEKWLDSLSRTWKLLDLTPQLLITSIFAFELNDAKIAAYETKDRSLPAVVHGVLGTQIDRESYPPSGDHYYEWRNNRLRLIRSVPKK